MGNYDFNDVETQVIDYWEKNDIYKKIKHKNHGKQKFYFLQGPPYTSGRIHMGTAWNHSLKDLILRYKRMRGFDVWDRGGWDMHGLPTESKVQKKFFLETKDDIIRFGVEKFIRECLKFSEENAGLMSSDFSRIGVWMNNKDAYMPINNSFMEGVWFLIKKAHEKNRLYSGKKVMTWCKSCETALSKHELEYKSVNDKSIFVKFKVKNDAKESLKYSADSKLDHNSHLNNLDDEYLIIWTTTPWTIPFNLAVMVNPELDYLRARVLVDEKSNKYETWIVSSALSGVFINGVAGKQFDIIEEFKGEKLLGTEYIHPFHKEMKIYSELKDKHKNVHTVILSEEYVDTSAGTGLVHCAPGCGPEDYEVGKAFNIPAFNDIDGLGKFGALSGQFIGMTAKDDDGRFIDILLEKGALIETSYVEHEYAHCNRCHNPVVFRTTDQWFFKTEDLRDRMIEFNKEIYWYPQAAKNAFDSWLKNLRDNSITKQRFWGTPVPIWVCANEYCKRFEVIGSIDELKEKSIGNKVPDNIHKPWIDDVKIKCSCGSDMHRIPDVLDVWIDAGSVSWNCLDYPKNNELMEKYFPADFIVEGKDQIRGWYNLLMVASTLALDKPAFKNVSMHGFITDVEGEKMSKSLGNIISPFEIVQKHGADTLRYYAIDITIGDDMNFSWDEVALKHKNLMILWNLHNFLLDFKITSGVSLKDNPALGTEERFMLSRLNSAIKDLTEHLEAYRLDSAPQIIESLYMDLSRVYIQLVREKSVSGSDEEKEAVLYTIYHALLGIIKMFSIVCPFISEKIYLNMRSEKDFPLEKISVHDFDWPSCDENMIDKELEKSLSDSQEFIQAILSCRDRINLGVRWPLNNCIVDTQDEPLSRSITLLMDVLKRQVNVKNIILKQMDTVIKVKPNFKNLGKDFGNMTSKVVELINLNASKIAGHLKENKPFNIEGFKITSNHVIVERLCPEGYEFSQVRGGLVFVDKTLTKELELEGYAREVIRRVQQLRKDSLLSKKDRIELAIVSEMDVSSLTEIISEKVGAVSIEFHEKFNNSKNYSFTSEETVKGKQFIIMLNKI